MEASNRPYSAGSFVPGLHPELTTYYKICVTRNELRRDGRGKEVFSPSHPVFDSHAYWRDRMHERVYNEKNVDDDDDELGDDDADEKLIADINQKENELNIPMDAPISVKKFRELAEKVRGTEAYWSVLQLAVRKRQNVFLDILLKSTIIDVNRIMDSRNHTLLHLAVLSTDVSRIKYLLSEGADANARNNAAQTPLHLALLPEDYQPIVRHKDVIRCLLEGGADVNAQDRRGRTPLHAAIGLCDYELVALFMQKGARASLKDNEGKVAFDLAKKKDAKRAYTIMVNSGTKQDIHLLLAHTMSKQLVASIFIVLSPTCSVCKRKMKDCGKLKMDNYRYWMYVHDRFRKEREKKA